MITYHLLFRELETAFDEERDACKAEKSKVASLEESLGSERKKLQEEIDEKLHIITDLSKQLEVHQKNFEALKSELNQVRTILPVPEFKYRLWTRFSIFIGVHHKITY